MSGIFRAMFAGHQRVVLLIGCGLFLIGTVAGSAWADEGLQWSFNQANDVRSVSHVEPGRLADGVLAGQTTWDPIVGLRVPPEGIDAARYTWLTVRLYSSEEADVLDIYYLFSALLVSIFAEFPG